MTNQDYFVHESSYVDEPCSIGQRTKIWHFSHVMKNCRIGADCNIGQNVVVSPDVVIGNNVKIQNNVSVYTGCILEDDVFCGPSMVFTNVINPAQPHRAQERIQDNAGSARRFDRRELHRGLRHHDRPLCFHRRRLCSDKGRTGLCVDLWQSRRLCGGGFAIAELNSLSRRMPPCARLVARPTRSKVIW